MAKKSKPSPKKRPPKPSKPRRKPERSTKAAKALQAKAERAADAIRDAFALTVQRLESGKKGPSWFKDIEATYSVQRYVDNAADGLLRLGNLPDDVTVSDVLLDLEEAEILAPPRRFKVWVQIGFTGDFAKPDVKRAKAKAQKAGIDFVPPPDAKPARYNRYKGQEITLLHSQRFDRVAEQYLGARVVADRLENKAKVPDAILIRYYWAPRMNQRPKDKGK